MLRPIRITLEMIKFQHTVFALPFAFLAALTAANGIPAWNKILWIIVAMIGARSAAMAFNRLVDQKIDAENPRTKSRALPAGHVTRAFVIVFTVASVALFVLAAAMLNRLALYLTPVALAIVLGYSFTKRFTMLSHVILGLSLAIAPIGASIAIEGRFDWKIFVLAASVLFWTAGFDVLYSLQDVEFDRERGLHSIPARIGSHAALWIARGFHVIAFSALVVFGLIEQFGYLYFVGLVPALALLVWQHSIVKADDISRIDAAFFTANGVLSIVLFVFGACDILIFGAHHAL